MLSIVGKKRAFNHRRDAISLKKHNAPTVSTAASINNFTKDRNFAGDRSVPIRTKDHDRAISPE